MIQVSLGVLLHAYIYIESYFLSYCLLIVPLRICIYLFRIVLLLTYCSVAYICFGYLTTLIHWCLRGKGELLLQRPGKHGHSWTTTEPRAAKQTTSSDPKLIRLTSSEAHLPSAEQAMWYRTIKFRVSFRR